MNAAEDQEPFDILDVERFRAGPAALWITFASLWGIGLTVRTPDGTHPVIVWMPMASVVLGWSIWLAYVVAQRRRIHRRADQALARQEAEGRDGADGESV